LTSKRILLVVGVCALLAVALGFFWPRRGSKVLTLPGVVEIQEVRLGSKIGGRVEKVDAVEGRIAEAGTVLVTFAAPELIAQREQARARLLQAEADWAKAKKGPREEEKEAARRAMLAAEERLKRVNKGWREEEKLQAQRELDSAEADLKLAQEKFDRTNRLYQQRVVSPEEFETARASLERLRGVERKAQAFRDMLQRGSREEDKEEAKALHEQAKANWDLLMAGTREEDKAAAEARVIEARGRLAELDANLAERLVNAPERVEVQVVSVRKGDIIAPNQPILRVLRTQDLWVRIYVPETELGKLKIGQKVTVTMDSYPGRKFAGTIMQIGSESEFTPRNIQSADERQHQVFGVKVYVADSQGVFKSGMAATVAIPLE
jgi:multidrug resistance efflux pump